MTDDLFETPPKQAYFHTRNNSMHMPPQADTYTVPMNHSMDLGGGSIIYDAKTNLPLFKVNSVQDWLERRKAR